MEASNGKTINVEFVSNVYDENHHNVIQCNIRDITERKRAAEAIASERERLAVALRSIGDSVITTDIYGNIDIMNKAAEELCGWKQAEVHGKPFASVFKVIDETTRELCENLLEKILLTGENIEHTNNMIVTSKDNTERIITHSAAPIKDKKNKVIGVVFVFQDITEKKKLLENSQRNQKLESLGVLAGGIAHDFNNLIGGILGYIDLAIEDTRDKKVKGYLTNAINIMDRARSLTSQLLTFAKGGSPIKKLEDLRQLIQDSVQFALSGSNINCQYDIPNDLWLCVIDKSQICQVIDNMVINAMQAMPSGGTIKIAANNIHIDDKDHQVLQKGNYVKISIKDYGVGICTSILSRIFDPFFTTKPAGQGLGLAICYSIINRHGGIMDVESNFDKGSTFHIYLPASLESVVLKEPVLTKHKSNGRMLIMDDEKMMRDVIGNMLENMGYSVVCKNGGKETLDFFIEEMKANRDIAGLVIDLTIKGGMGGLYVVNEIRKMDLTIPIFVISGYADDPVMMNPASYGFTGSICKPFRKIELEEMLEKHLN